MSGHVVDKVPWVVRQALERVELIEALTVADARGRPYHELNNVVSPQSEKR